MKKVLITGGSSGIGFEMSKYFALHQYEILWVSLFQKELEKATIDLQKEVPSVKISHIAIDLSNNEAAKQVYDWVNSTHGAIDVLINNAGFGTYGFVNEIDMEKELKMIQCNAVSLYALTRLFLKDMVAKNEGQIINISSNSSFQPVPRMVTYASTKAFVKHFSRGLSEELKMMNSKVKVMTVCPSAIADTPFKKQAGMSNVKTFNGLAFTTQKEVAEDIWKGFKRKKDFVVSGWRMRILYFISPLIPYRVTQFLTKKETERVT